MGLDPAERVAAIRRWMVLPEFASVNWHEPGADAVAAALWERGVGVEAGLWHAEAVLAWLASHVRDQCFRVLIELPDGLDAAKTVVEADHLINLIDDGMQGSAADVQVLLHGEGTSCWPALMHAGRRGLSTRIGLEDVLTLPDGDPAPDNASLVTAAIDLLRPRRVSQPPEIKKTNTVPWMGVPRNRVVLLGGLGGLPAAAEQTVKGVYHNYSLKQLKGPTFTN